MGESLQEQLDEQLRRSSEKRAPAVNATLAAAMEQLRRAGVGEDAPRAGDRAPGFTLSNVRGETVELGALLARGPLVLAFYRGVW